MNQSNQQQISVAGAGSIAVDNETPPKIFMLRVDIFETIFDYMSLRDILAMSETCKVMRKVAGSYFQPNFPECVRMRDKENFESIYINGFSTLRDGFEEFISKLVIQCPVKNILKSESFSSLKHLDLRGNFDSAQLQYVKHILKNVEILSLRYIYTTDELYEQLLNFCTVLKELHINSYTCSRPLEITHNWLQRNATLERLICGAFEIFENEKLKILLQENPNLKHLKINAGSIWDNRNAFAAANIQLDCLILYFWGIWAPSRQFADLLIQLNARGFFKKLDLRIHTSECSQEFINQVASMNALQSIFFVDWIPDVDLSPMIHLKELYFLRMDVASSMEMDNLARNLVNLESFSVTRAITDVIIPFLRNSKKLKVVKVRGFTGGDLLKDDILDIAALNQLRQELNGARKVSIYVEEKVYLATKWVTKNWDFNLVEIKRAESIKLGDAFSQTDFLMV